MVEVCSIDGCEKSASTRGWCHMHYWRWRTHGDPLRLIGGGRRPVPIEDRFWAEVQRGGPDECWNWTGYVERGGYGVIAAGSSAVKAQRWKAHRLSYTLLVGEIPEGMTIDHLCFNTVCVNPSHLEVVTLSENARRSRRSQFLRSKTHCPQGHPYAGDNLVIRPNGNRKCRECTLIDGRLRYWRKKREAS